MASVEERLVETEVSRKRKEKRSERFLASMPLTWAIQAGRLPGKTMQVALAIRHQARLRKTKTISFGNQLLAEFGVTKDVKRRALEALEQAGLIKVERSPGMNPLVSIIEVDSN